MSVLEEHCPDLMANFTFVKETSVEFSIKKLGKMPFKLIDRTWERYGIARVYDISESSEVPITVGETGLVPAHPLLITDNYCSETRNDKISPPVLSSVRYLTGTLFPTNTAGKIRHGNRDGSMQKMWFLFSDRQ